MRNSGCQKAAFLAVLLSITAGLTSGVRGQAEATAATVSVSRHDQLWGRVWPGDFNGDGRKDTLAANRGNPGIDIILDVLLGHDGTFSARRPTTTRSAAPGRW
jgi:hypothetical protein